MEARHDFLFLSYPDDPLPSLKGTILLTLEAPPLTKEDSDHPLFLIDATWKKAEKMRKKVEGQEGLLFRSIPSGWLTAYPRCQEDCPDPKKGLASIEALFAAFSVLGLDTKGLLDQYYWKELFLKRNLIPTPKNTVLNS